MDRNLSIRFVFLSLTIDNSVYIYILLSSYAGGVAMGKWQGRVEGFMKQLQIASAENVSKPMASLGAWTAGPSAVNNTAKELNTGVALGRIEKGRGYYRVPGCRSEWGAHAKKLSAELARILAHFPESEIRREVFVQVLGRRADAILLVRRGNEAACLVFECTNTETAASFTQKAKQWREWPGALQFLSDQFGIKIPSFTVLGSSALDSFLGGEK